MKFDYSNSLTRLRRLQCHHKPFSFPVKTNTLFSGRYKDMARQFPVQGDPGILDLDNKASGQAGNHRNGTANDETKGFKPLPEGLGTVYPADRNSRPMPGQ
jgi:hypothetical protein